MNKQIVIIGLLSLALGICRLSMASVAEENDKEGKAKIPDTVAGIWAEVKEHEQEVGKTIAAKKLDKVPEGAFRIRDIVNALPDNSKGLPADKLAKVKANAEIVADLTNRLGESSGANNSVETEANFKKLQGVLNTIESLYPPETLAAQGEWLTCSSHPDVRFRRGEACPKCNMHGGGMDDMH